MRDIITIPFNDVDSLIIACDNSGAIGMKEHDHVFVSYETVAYYSFRVAVMECIAAGGQPISVVLHNFCGNEPWEELVRGIQKGLIELNLKNVSITGSTESNFSLLQSALGLVVLGKKSNALTTVKAYSEQLKIAVIGMPLVGNEVIEQNDDVAPLSIFQEISMVNDVMIWPVGSKGILYEINQMYPTEVFSKEMVITNVDVLKSAGPATCFIVFYHAGQEDTIMKLAGNLFNSVQIITVVGD
ncbi:MAG: ATP-binding protein [Bacillus sp. (in: Bacteria)]|nr:ATP-binding protein [Bacillus sp. (in: firmicutes)]